MDQAVARDEAVAIDNVLFHSEVVAAVADQLVGFDESAFVEKQIDPFARGELAFSVLPFAACIAASSFGASVTPS
jgi:hypothetical protein